MEIITFNFITLLGYKKIIPSLEINEIKNMSMLRRQVWMADDDKFDHIVKNPQRVLLSKAQYENHPYVEEFTKECNVMFVYGTYVLEGEVDAKLSLDDIWNLFQGDTLPNNASNFCRQVINCMKARNYLQKLLDLPLNTEIIRQTHKIVMEDEKDVLVGKGKKVTCICRLSYGIHGRHSF